MPRPTDDLSPLPVPPRHTDLPFGLTWDDVAPCLPGFAQPGSSWLSHRKRGLQHGDRSSILTLSYVRTDGSPARRTLFFKHSSDPSTYEGEKYRFLMSREAPVAPLLRFVLRPDAEILVVSFLPVIGTGADDADTLLKLIAKINSVVDPPAALFRSRPGRAGYGDRIRDILISLAGDVAISVPVEPDRWIRAYRQATEQAMSQPTALNHNELSFQQVGWTHNDGHGGLVVFDLETMALRPPYTDIAGILHPLARQTGRAERELFGVYLDALADHSGTTHDAESAWRTMLATRIVRSAESLPWLKEMADNPDVGDTPSDAAAQMHRDLTELGLD